MKIPVSQTLARIEGHGKVVLQVSGGSVKDARWEVVEPKRHFESMLIGKPWQSAPWVTSRVCGICSISHNLASILAVENAFGISPSKQTQRLRLILKHMETLQSHSLHLYYLCLPDYKGADSILPLIKSDREIVERACRIKKLANDVCDAIGGRRLHPTATAVGGFTVLPDKRVLEDFNKRLFESKSDIELMAGVYAGVEFPIYEKQTGCLSVSGPRYSFIGNDLMLPDGRIRQSADYKSLITEYEVRNSSSKWTSINGKVYAVGPLSRFNNGHEMLHPAASVLARSLGLNQPVYNPFMNNIARLVESMHVVVDSIGLIEEHLDEKEAASRVDVEPKASTGAASVEAPRGTLFHSYGFDKKGIIKYCDLLIPTGQNHAAIEMHLKEFVSKCASEGLQAAEIRRLAEMLVRSFDPCVSCSVH